MVTLQALTKGNSCAQLNIEGKPFFFSLKGYDQCLYPVLFVQSLKSVAKCDQVVL